MFHFITRCSRLENLTKVGSSIFNKDTKSYDITWHVLFDKSKVKEVPTPVLSYLSSVNSKIYYKINRNDYLHTAISEVISEIKDGYVHIIDDDNILHREYLPTLTKNINKSDKPLIYVYQQQVDGKDFTGLDVRLVGPEFVKVGSIDMAQFTAHSSLMVEDIPKDYVGEGMLLDKMFKKNPEHFKFIDKILCHYNYLQQPKKRTTYHLPRVLLVGEKDQTLTTSKFRDFWETRLVTHTQQTDINISEKLVEISPDVIITTGDTYLKYPNLNKKAYNTRRKWIHIDKVGESTGDLAYSTAMNSMLLDDTSELISFFTPTYNTKEKLHKTYQSLVQQTYNNWEWVIVDDSNDNDHTYRIAKDISSKDERVKVYSFKEKSKGIIGESKYRAASLCSGEILAELDHDDILLEKTAEYLNKAQKELPDVGFFYSDCIEVDENFNSLTYPEGFAFGYGSYYDFEWRGKIYKAAKECNINPKTIRHIVSVPNHIRAWRRSTYHLIKGHNRALPIADDYELIVRTFLTTRLCRIPYPGYIQLLYDNSEGTNTHNATRKDIQRRVWSIANFYNEKIKDRFHELGVEDWAHKENPNNPTWVESKYGKEEGQVNLVFDLS